MTHPSPAHAQSTPSLADQPRIFLETQLVVIREGLREIPAMKGLLDKLTDPDLTALAAWYSAQQQVPRLAGQREDYLQQTMVQRRDGKAAGRDSIMAATLRGMSDAQLADLAKHFAGLR